MTGILSRAPVFGSVDESDAEAPTHQMELVAAASLKPAGWTVPTGAGVGLAVAKLNERAPPTKSMLMTMYASLMLSSHPAD